MSDEAILADNTHLEPEVLAEFRTVRESDEWKKKRKKAQGIAAQNKTKTTSSRGGYAYVRKNEKSAREKKMKEMEDSGLEYEPLPEITVLDVWKGARKKKSGEYSSEASREVAMKIDELWSQVSQGTSTPQEHQNILSAAIGKPKHPGRLRGAGQGRTMKEVFGTSYSSCSSRGMDVDRLKAELTAELTVSLTAKISAGWQTQFDALVARLASVETTQKRPEGDLGAHMSSKANCPAMSTHSLPHLCLSADKDGLIDLYTDVSGGSVLHVGRGKIIEGATTCHGNAITDDMDKVNVLDVFVSAGNTLLPVACAEFESVRDALNSFVPWPQRLLGVVRVPKEDNPSMKQKISIDDPIHRLVDALTGLYKKSTQFPWDPAAFGLDTDAALQISYGDLMDIIGRKDWYLIKSLKAANDDLYAFFEPSMIADVGGNSVEKASDYMSKHMLNSHKKIFLGAHNRGDHWQLVVLMPHMSYAYWFCSIAGTPRKFIREAIQVAVKKYVAAVPAGTITRLVEKAMEVDWQHLKCNKQSSSWECAYYVMEWMKSIVTAKINTTRNWKGIFNTPQPLPDEKIDDIRAEWARIFLEHHIPTGDED